MGQWPQITVTFRAHEKPLHEELMRYANAEALDPRDAVKRLLIAGLKLPHFVGSPPPKHNPVDALLDGVIPRTSEMDRDERDTILAEATRLREEASPEKPTDEGEVPSGDELPLLGYPEVDALLRDHFKTQRKENAERAKQGAFDRIFEEDDVAEALTGSTQPDDAHEDAEAAGDGNTPPHTDTLPYDTARTPAPTRPITVREPESGAMVEVTPQRVLGDDAMVAIDTQLHEAVAPVNRPPRPAPQSEILMALVNAQNLR